MKFSLDQLKDADQLAQAGANLAFNVVAALAIFFAGKWLAQGLIRVLRAASHRARVDETLADFIANVAYGFAIAVVVIAAAGTLGVDTTSAAALVGGAALAIGLSLQSQIASFAAGVIIIMLRPFSKGDYVEIAGIKGHVEEIKIVSTQLRTPDHKRVIVPNSSITTNVITNYTAMGTRRIELVVAVSHEADLLQAKALLGEVLAGDRHVLKSPAPCVRVRELTSIAVEFELWAWVKTDDITDARAALLEGIKLKLDAVGIKVPAPDGRARAAANAPPPAA